MLINCSDIQGLPVVDLSTGSRVGGARTFLAACDCVIKGLLVRRDDGSSILVEPSRILGLGSAAAVVDLDENALLVPGEEGEGLVPGRPVISILGEPAGKLVNCTIDLESFEIREIMLVATDKKTEFSIAPEQVRTLGDDFIILAPGALEDPASPEVSVPVAADTPEAPPHPEIEVEIAAMDFDPVARPAIPVPVMKLSRDLTETPRKPLLGALTAPVVLSVPEEPDADMAELEIDTVEDPAQEPELPDIDPRQAKIDSLVNKSLGRTLAIDIGGEQTTLQAGTVITREMAEEIASGAPLLLETLPLFVE